MSAPLPNALRERFQRLSEEGLSGRAAALRLKLSPATGARWARQVRTKGHAEPAPQGPPRGKGKLAPGRVVQTPSACHCGLAGSCCLHSLSSFAGKRLPGMDETAVKTNLARLRGRAKRGQRLTMDAPFGSWGTQTLIAGLTQDALIAPWVIKDAMDGPAFAAYIREVLVPEIVLGTVVILDNLATHRNKEATQALRDHAAGSSTCRRTRLT